MPTKPAQRRSRFCKPRNSSRARAASSTSKWKISSRPCAPPEFAPPCCSVLLGQHQGRSRRDAEAVEMRGRAALRVDVMRMEVIAPMRDDALQRRRRIEPDHGPAKPRPLGQPGDRHLIERAMALEA